MFGCWLVPVPALKLQANFANRSLLLPTSESLWLGSCYDALALGNRLHQQGQTFPGGTALQKPCFTQAKRLVGLP